MTARQRCFELSEKQKQEYNRKNALLSRLRQAEVDARHAVSHWKAQLEIAREAYQSLCDAKWSGDQNED